MSNGDVDLFTQFQLLSPIETKIEAKFTREWPNGTISVSSHHRISFKSKACRDILDRSLGSVFADSGSLRKKRYAKDKS